MRSRRHCAHCEQARRSMRTDPTRCSHCQRPFPAPEADTGPRCPRCGGALDPNASLFGGGEQCSACRLREVRP